MLHAEQQKKKEKSCETRVLVAVGLTQKTLLTPVTRVSQKNCTQFTAALSVRPLNW